MSKTHYRRVFKSDHLGSADIEEMIEDGKRLVFTINKVEQYLMVDGDKNSGISVAGRRISANIAYFKEDIKPLVLNATNSKQVSKFACSKFVDEWSNIPIELYIDPSVKMKGDIVGGVRIRPFKPTAKVKPLFTVENFDAAKGKKATIESIEKHYTVTDEIKQQYLKYETKK